MVSATMMGAADCFAALFIAGNTLPKNDLYSVMLLSIFKSIDVVPKLVLVKPGSTIFTLTPMLAISYINASDIPSTANLVPLYSVPMGTVILPPIEDTLIIMPSLLVRKCGRTALVTINRPMTFTSYCLLILCSGVAS